MSGSGFHLGLFRHSILALCERAAKIIGAFVAKFVFVEGIDYVMSYSYFSCIY